MKSLFRLAAASMMTLAATAWAHDYTLRNIAIGHPYARSTVAGQPTGGAYLKLDNRGPGDDRLVSATTGVADHVELHTSRMEGDVMRMRQVDAIDLPAKKAVELQPGGTHLMLVGLKAPLEQGQSFPMTLKFEKAGELTVDVKVQAMDGAMKH